MASLTLGVIHQPAIGERAIGDDYCVIEGEGYLLIAAADGLGHGPEAQEASGKAIKTVQAHATLPPKVLLERVHTAVRGTRGVVIAIARIDVAAQTLTYAGLGNIDARIVSEHKTYRPICVNGIAGHQARYFREESFPFTAGDLLIMHSDGISDRFEITAMARQRDPQMLANQIAQTHGKDHDDQLLLIARLAP
jgi:serine phosphatase RsbU (regulator of sigma subunit)